MSLADQLDGTLVTGDNALRNAADNEDVEVHGTISIGERLLDHDLVDEPELRTAYQTMRDGDRRLPWGEIDDRFDNWRLTPLS
ncbi:MAG: hypothetical protein ABEN55_12545 [Bradymonadaceae bacterium]